MPSLGIRTGIDRICVPSVLTCDEECKIIRKTQISTLVSPSSANVSKIFMADLASYL